MRKEKVGSKTQMKRKSGFLSKDVITSYAFLGPNVLGFLIFTLIPVAVSFGLAFVDWDIIIPAKFVGFKNFINDKDIKKGIGY